MIVEGLAAIAVFFLLLVIIVQLAFVLVAREVSQSAVDAAARRASRPSADLSAIEAQLATELVTVVPGARDVDAAVRSTGAHVDVGATVGWSPPGPDLVPVVIRVVSSAPIAVPP